MQGFKRFCLILIALLSACGSVLAQSYDTAEETVSEQIVHESNRYLSTVYTTATEGGNGLHETIRAETVARDGMYAGQTLTLSQLLGVEQETETGSMASRLVYDLIWQIIEAERADPETEYLEDLAKADLESVFSPETDYYLDADGNVVFFIQSGEIAGEVAGVLVFPFAPAELLSAVHE